MLHGSERKHAEDTEANRELVEVMEVVGKQVGDKEGVGRGAGGPEEVRKVVGKCGRGGKARKVTVHYKHTTGKLSNLFL